MAQNKEMRRIFPVLAALCGLSLILFFAFATTKERSAVNKTKNSLKSENSKNMGNLKISSPFFQDGGKIPARYTCDGVNLSPAIQIEGAPKETKSLVLILDDPDAVGGKTWDHWLIWNISPETIVIPEGGILAGAVSGLTSFGDKKYGGPCPPSGSGLHHYRFKLYALDSILNLPPDSLKNQVEKAMEGHVLDKTILTGLYERF